jgi:hypothetical protein
LVGVCCGVGCSLLLPLFAVLALLLSPLLLFGFGLLVLALAFGCCGADAAADGVFGLGFVDEEGLLVEEGLEEVEEEEGAAFTDGVDVTGFGFGGSPVLDAFSFGDETGEDEEGLVLFSVLDEEDEDEEDEGDDDEGDDVFFSASFFDFGGALVLLLLLLLLLDCGLTL